MIFIMYFDVYESWFPKGRYLSDKWLGGYGNNFKIFLFINVGCSVPYKIFFHNMSCIDMIYI